MAASPPRALVRLGTAVAACAAASALGLPIGAGQLPAASASVAGLAATVHPVLLLVDTSGSMSEDDGTGRVKMDGAKRALIDFVRGLPADVPRALRHYPGGDANDAQGCSKGDLRVNFGEQDLSKVDAEIRSLMPSGQTPTAAALTQASEDFKQTEQKTGTIVLVSDGLSNCGDDPCEVAETISGSGVDITVNTVGFKISAEGRAQLQCIADTTNGLYADVNSNVELVAQLNQLSQPLLDAKLDYPSRVKAAVGQDASGTVTITAQVTDVGAVEVQDAQATLQFKGQGAPSVISPRRRLGNLGAGDTRAVSWQFRPPFDPRVETLDFTVDLRGRNSPARAVNGRITLDQDVSLHDAGPLLRNAHRVAILGDSYSAGEGTGSYTSDTQTLTNSCHRSSDTYGVSLWTDRGAPGDRVDNWACSGAVTTHLRFDNDDNLGQDGEPEPAQVDRLEDTAYDLVLMTMGGNDIGFPEVVKFCALTLACHERSLDDVLDVPWRWPTYREYKIAAANGVQPQLVDSYREVEDALNSPDNMRRRGRPGAVVVLAYPMPMPLTPGAALYRWCSPLAVDVSERLFVQELVTALNNSAQAAVEQLRREGRPAYFVPDTVDAFQPDHTYCGEKPFVNRLSAVKTVSSITAHLIVAGTGWFLPPGVEEVVRAIRERVLPTQQAEVLNRITEQVHPNAEGYQAITHQLVRWSTSAAARSPVRRTAESRRRNTDPQPDVTATISAGSSDAVRMRPGDVVQVRGAGLAPHSTAELWLLSDPVLIDRTTSDASGRVVFQGRVPTGTRVGSHHLGVIGTDPRGQLVSQSREAQLRRDRPWWVYGFAGAGLLGVGGAVLLRRRARPLPGEPAESAGSVPAP